MKSFKHALNEQKKKYSREEMIKWCMFNIIDFDIQKENTSHEQSNNGFEIIETSQTVRRGKKFDLEITTNDIELPFKFVAPGGEIIVTAPNLQKLSITDTFSTDDAVTLSLKKCNSLNCENLGHIIGMIIAFSKMDKIEPRHIKNEYFGELHFVFCSSPKIYDFSNYDGALITYLNITKSPQINFMNMLQLIENENIKINEVAFYNNFIYDLKLSDVVNKYIKLKNKLDYMMDFTIEMIDDGFEDIL